MKKSFNNAVFGLFTNFLAKIVGEKNVNKAVGVIIILAILISAYFQLR